VNARPNARNVSVPKCVSFGWTSSTGILTTSSVSSATLTMTRTPSLVAPESLTWRQPLRVPAVGEAAIPSCYGFVRQRFRPP
jgi:hypothetical protein